jgi:hypothetical protein
MNKTAAHRRIASGIFTIMIGLWWGLQLCFGAEPSKDPLISHLEFC